MPNLVRVAGAIAGALALAGFAFASEWAGPAIGFAAVIGLLLGAVLAQALLWLRAAARQRQLLERTMREQTRQMTEQLRELRRSVRELERGRDRDIKRIQSSVDRRLAEMQKVGRSSSAAMRSAISAQSVERRATRRMVMEQASVNAAQLEAYLQLTRLVPMPLPMPTPGGWAASEDLLLTLVGEVLERRPKVVVDLGSGQSSVWMAGAMRAAGIEGRVIAFDHEQSYADATRALGQRQGVERWLEVRVAPLEEQSLAGRLCTWYDVDCFADLQEIELVSVDGPPAVDDPSARWPAVPVLRERLAPGARIVFDDMIREGEQRIVEEYAQMFPEATVSELPLRKSAAILVFP